MSEADQKAEGNEDEDIIKYNQEIIAFNTNDFYWILLQISSRNNF